MKDAVLVTVLTTEDLIQYTVPSFPVFKVMLREVKLQWEEESRTISVFDATVTSWITIFQPWWRHPLTTRMPLLSRYIQSNFPYNNYFNKVLQYINYVIETFQFCESCFFDKNKSSTDAFPLKNINSMMEIRSLFCRIRSGLTILILKRRTMIMQ